MALFTLSDIKIKGEKNIRGTSNIIPTRYSYNTFRYPEDIGNLDKGHYMVIHINEQTKTQFPSTPSNDLPTIFENRNRTGVSSGGAIATQQLSSLALSVIEQIPKNENFVESLRTKVTDAITTTFGISRVTASNFTNFVVGIARGGTDTLVSTLKNMSEGKFVRTIRRTTDTVALYMPDTLNFSYEQSYPQAELGGGVFGLVGAGADYASKFPGISKTDSEKIGSSLMQNLSPFILQQISSRFGNAGIAVFAAAFGTVVNPQLELIYSSPKFRNFRFDFMFYPRSSTEALQVQMILERLKFHQAPEVLGAGSAGGLGSFFLVPPSEFDIKFYYNGIENPNIPKISTCVLSNIDIDYAPNGFSAYEVPGRNDPYLAGTGMPVAIRMTLTFQETEILTKANFNSVNPITFDTVNPKENISY
jgi:hypothetical protein